MTVSLTEIERLEHLAVDLLAKATNPASSTRLQKCLAAIRAIKADYLREHPEVLRKLGTAPAPKDAPNAPMPMPDGSVGSTISERLFRAPAELAGMSIHTCRGQINIPDHGIIHTNAQHEDLHRQLRGRGFREVHALDRFGKSATIDPVQMFERARLKTFVPGFIRGHQGAQ